MRRFNRILLKISGEALQKEPAEGQKKELGTDQSTVMAIAKKIRAVHDLGIQVAVVIGGGNLFRGKDASQYGMDRVTADNVGMLATVMNGLVLADALAQCQVAARVQSALGMPEAAELYIRNKALRHLEKRRVLILTAGTGVPYVTTDTGASLRALELKCEAVFKATKVDGVFDRDPKIFPQEAKRYLTLNYHDAISMDEIKVIDKPALDMCQKNNLPTLVFSIFSQADLLAAAQGEAVGTYLDSQVETAFA
jgi:uridylate kinase